MFQDSVLNVQKVELRCGGEGKSWNEQKLLELQGGDDNFLARASQTVAVGATDFLDESVEAQTLQQARYLATALVGQVVTEGEILKAPDVGLASGQGFEELLIFFGKEVEAPIGAAVLEHGFRQPALGSARVEKYSK